LHVTVQVVYRGSKQQTNPNGFLRGTSDSCRKQEKREVQNLVLKKDKSAEIGRAQKSNDQVSEEYLRGSGTKGKRLAKGGGSGERGNPGRAVLTIH